MSSLWHLHFLHTTSSAISPNQGQYTALEQLGMASDTPIHLNVPHASFEKVKVLFFDLMGTCLDWHSSIVRALPANNLLLPSSCDLQVEQEHLTPQSQFALRWRQGFFDEIHARFERGEGQEDIDVTHLRVLDRLLLDAQPADEEAQGTWSESQRRDAVDAWHDMRAWPDVGPALQRLRRTGYRVFVLANGTTKLQLDLVRSSGLEFDMLFSSQLLGLTKPDDRIYERALELVGGGRLTGEECVMVAAHAYDLRAAREVGMRTVYIERWTEDGREDMGLVKEEFDGFVDGRSGSETRGLARLAALLGALG